MEVWRPSNYAENYEVSNDGNIRNLKTGKILKGSTDSQGYKTVSVRINDKQKTKKVHRLVADAFLEEDIRGIRVSHKDGNKRNNKIDNLEIGKGVINTNKKKIKIIETGEVFDSVSECSRATGLNRSSISKCLNYSFYNNRYGYHFEAVD